jgi:LAO/AO transport system kinase
MLYPKTGKAHVIGVTGPTGSGKSTLIEKLIRELRKRGKTVGIVAVDPTSPFTGGAFLGDRVRMQEHSTDEGVFIRSMATRNAPGGLAKATKDAIRVLDASGKDVIIVETVGAGQSEVEVVKVAHTVIVVLAPGLGDDIQAIKAGIMEIGDIFVVNKADRENANKAVSDIQAMLEMNAEKTGWKPSVLKTTALTGEGINELLTRIEEHKEYLKTGALEASRKEKVETELVEAIKQKIAESIVEDLKSRGEWEKLTQKILARETDPYSAADMLLKKSKRN